MQPKCPGCTAWIVPLRAGDPTHATCRAHRLHAASLSTGAFIAAQETPNRNRATLAYPSSWLGFLPSNALFWGGLVFFAANHDPACLQRVACFSSPQSPNLLLGPGLFGQLAEAAPAACQAASCRGRAAAPGGFGREPWLTRWAACPGTSQRLVGQEQAEAVEGVLAWSSAPGSSAEWYHSLAQSMSGEKRCCILLARYLFLS